MCFVGFRPVRTQVLYDINSGLATFLSLSVVYLSICVCVFQTNEDLVAVRHQLWTSNIPLCFNQPCVNVVCEFQTSEDLVLYDINSGPATFLSGFVNPQQVCQCVLWVSDQRGLRCCTTSTLDWQHSSLVSRVRVNVCVCFRLTKI